MCGVVTVSDMFVVYTCMYYPHTCMYPAVVTITLGGDARVRKGDVKSDVGVLITNITCELLTTPISDLIIINILNTMLSLTEQ